MRKLSTKRIALGVACIASLGGCASGNRTVEMSNGYAIYDIKPENGTSAAVLAEAVKTAIQKNTSKAQVQNSIPPYPLPEKAPRFQLVSPFKGTALGALAAANGQSMQIPSCDGAIQTINAKDDSMSKYAEYTTFFTCLMPYQGGYSLNIYTTFSKASGTFSAAIMAATLARTVTGDSSQFIPRTIGAIVASLQQTGATVSQTEAYP